MDDDTFIQAILAAPKNDAPRVAYADALDAQDDPRGAYLRDEMAWAASRDEGEASALREKASGLDVVWVSRVTRPPLGVCIEHIDLPEYKDDRFLEDRPRPRPTDADLDWLEKRFDLTLPPDYRAFLLNYNGGMPRPCPSPTGLYWVTILETFWKAEDSEAFDPENPYVDWDDDLVFTMQTLELYYSGAMDENDDWSDMAAFWSDEKRRNLTWIGYADPNGEVEVYCLGVRGEEFGKVYWVATGPDYVEPEEDCQLIAETFAEFLGKI